MQDVYSTRTNTLDSTYIQSEIRHIISELRKKGLIITSKAQLKKSGSSAVDCTGLDSRSVLKKALKRQSYKILKEIEDYDYKKGYKYSMMFRKVKAENFVGEHKAIIYKSTSVDHIGKIIEKPTIRTVGDETFIKFTQLMPNKNNPDEKRLYTIIVIINNSDGIVEFRFDQVSDRFKVNDQFYIQSVKKVKSWIEAKFDIRLKTLNFTYIIDKIVNNNDENIKVCYEDMILENNCRASFQATENTLELPVIGDFQKIIQDHPAVFDEKSKARKIIEEYIEKVYATSEFPKRGIRWLKEKKQVMFIHNYKTGNDTLIHHYAENNNKEMMDHVREYVIKHRKKVKRKQSN